LNFFMLERPESIEFPTIFDRSPYISYPPGTIVPPYLMAKVLHKDQIQIDFVRQFLVIKSFLDTFLVCLVFFGILTYCLRIRHIKWAALISVVLSLSWMCLPINLWALRNVYFSDEAVVTTVLLFIWMEIYETFFRSKTLPVKSLYFILKFLIVLAGTLIDYYFLLVVFVAWLIKIVPLFKLRDKKISSILIESLIYVLPVLIGLLLFFIQISTVPDFLLKMRTVVEFRTYSEYSEHGNWAVIAKRVLRNFGLIGILIVIAFFVLAIKTILSKRKINKDYLSFIKISLLMWIPPIVHILIFQQHSAQHEVSMVKFALPFILALFTVLWYVFRRYKNPTILYSGIIMGLIGTVTLINISYFNNFYEATRPGDYELEYLMREHWKYEDVYFSFTDSIKQNPPVRLSISNKMIHKVDDISDIKRLFPNLDKGARILFVVRKDDSGKNDALIEKENYIIANSTLLFENKDYGIYLYKLFPDALSTIPEKYQFKQTFEVIFQYESIPIFVV